MREDVSMILRDLTCSAEQSLHGGETRKPYFWILVGHIHIDLIRITLEYKDSVFPLHLIGGWGLRCTVNLWNRCPNEDAVVCIRAFCIQNIIASSIFLSICVPAVIVECYVLFLGVPCQL